MTITITIGKKNNTNETTKITHVERSTPQERKKYGSDIHGWCDCGKPIEGRVRMAKFCPWCGKVMVWNK